VQLYAFDMLAGDGDDMRQLPLSMRKVNLARLLARRTEGIFIAPIRTRRDRPGPVSGGLQHGSRGSGIEAPGSSLSWRTVATLDQGEEPAAPCDGSGHGVIQMTTLDKLLAQKQELIERLQQEDIGPEERDEIERLLERIEVALDLLDKAGPSRR
jgi:hypothetical protein